MTKVINLNRNTKQTKNRQVIGITGTHAGVGVTFTGLMLAFYFGEECNKKTAYLECNDSGDFGRINSSYQWKRGEVSFSFHQVTCYPMLKKDDITQILNEDYEYIIIDFGSDLSASIQEFLRCNTKLIIGGRAPWEVLKLVDFVEENTKLSSALSWHYLIPLASSKMIKEVKQTINKEVMSIPYREEAVLATKEISHFFKRIFY